MQRRAAVAVVAVGVVGLATLLVVGAVAVGVLDGGLPDADRAGPTGPGDGRTPASGAVGDGGTAAAASQPEDAIVETVEYRLFHEDPERVEATIHYAVPDNVESLRFRIVGGSYEVVATDGFERTDDGAFAWTGAGTGGSVAIRHAADESFRAEDADERYVGGTADWAVVARPQTNTNFTYYAPEPPVEYRLAVAGEGRAGERLAYLGPYREYAETVDGERLVLVVPDAADPVSEPDAILDSLAYASDRLRVGNRNDEVVVIVAPAGEVEWGPPGLTIGADARVAADTAVDEPVNVWIHEYVHTRQYRDHRRPGEEAVAADARWLVEGTADYYGALFNLELGHTEFEDFHRVLERGAQPPVADAVLGDPATWTDDAEYEKGALVAAAVDLRIRAASGGEATLQHVIAEWNRRDSFDAADLGAVVEEYGNASVRDFVERYTTTAEAPAPRDRDDHARYFDADIAQFDYEATGEPAMAVTGPFREGALPRTVATGESVTVEVTATNVGGAEGPYRAVLVANGDRVDLREGRLSPGESEATVLEYAFEAPGEVTLRAGDETRTVFVREPASPVLVELTAGPEEPAVGEEIAIAVTVHNPATHPAAGTVEVELDGEPIASETVHLAPNGSTTVEATTSVGSPGDHVIGAGDLSVTVTAEEADPLDALAGAGPAVAVLAVLLAAAHLATGRRARR